jgi:hypothetical protein
VHGAASEPTLTTQLQVNEMYTKHAAPTHTTPLDCFGFNKFESQFDSAIFPHSVWGHLRCPTRKTLIAVLPRLCWPTSVATSGGCSSCQALIAQMQQRDVDKKVRVTKRNEPRRRIVGASVACPLSSGGDRNSCPHSFTGLN